VFSLQAFYDCETNPSMYKDRIEMDGCLSKIVKYAEENQQAVAIATFLALAVIVSH